MSSDNFRKALLNSANTVEEYLRTEMPDAKDTISEAMHYGVLNGGKRLRAFLAYESATLFDISPDIATPAAAAIECLHAYSLVHDDLPCMDDDDLRRGKPTVHIKWDEATAVLVGDALQTQAFGFLANMQCSEHTRLELIRDFVTAAGVQGMVRGQAMDIAAESSQSQLTLPEITELQALKTGALIKWSAKVGPILANSDTRPLEQYADALGLAFQIHDDILDIEGDAEAAGKRLRKDTDAGKATFVSLLGLNGAKLRAKELVDAASDALEPFGEKAENLRQAAQYTITRAT